MKHISFLSTRPQAGWGEGRVYSLAWKPRYDGGADSAVPRAFATLRYLVDGDPVPEAELTFEVDDQLEFERQGAGPGTGGVLRVLLSTRRADLTRAQFAHHWRTVHAPLAIGLGPSYDYYVTNIVLDEASPWDGVLQEWFPDEATFDEHDGGLADRKRIVADDYPLFLATSGGAPQWLATELDPA